MIVTDLHGDHRDDLEVYYKRESEFFGVLACTKSFLGSSRMALCKHTHLNGHFLLSKVRYLIKG